MLDYYENRHFLNKNGEPDLVVMPEIIMSILCDNFKLKEVNSIKPKIRKPYQWQSQWQ